MRAAVRRGPANPDKRRVGGELFDRGRTLLMLSHTETAVDGALPKIHNELAENAHALANEVVG